MLIRLFAVYSRCSRVLYVKYAYPIMQNMLSTARRWLLVSPGGSWWLLVSPDNFCGASRVIWCLLMAL